MNKEEVFNQMVSILTPFSRNEGELEKISEGTTILNDLNVNSSRLVDVVLQIEDKFDIEIDDNEVELVSTVGSAVDLILKKTA